MDEDTNSELDLQQVDAQSALVQSIIDQPLSNEYGMYWNPEDGTITPEQKFFCTVTALHSTNAATIMCLLFGVDMTGEQDTLVHISTRRVAEIVGLDSHTIRDIRDVVLCELRLLESRGCQSDYKESALEQVNHKQGIIETRARANLRYLYDRSLFLQHEAELIAIMRQQNATPSHIDFIMRYYRIGKYKYAGFVTNDRVYERRGLIAEREGQNQVIQLVHAWRTMEQVDTSLASHRWTSAVGHNVLSSQVNDQVVRQNPAVKYGSLLDFVMRQTFRPQDFNETEWQILQLTLPSLVKGMPSNQAFQLALRDKVINSPRVYSFQAIWRLIAKLEKYVAVQGTQSKTSDTNEVVHLDNIRKVKEVRINTQLLTIVINTILDNLMEYYIDGIPTKNQSGLISRCTWSNINMLRRFIAYTLHNDVYVGYDSRGMLQGQDADSFQEEFFTVNNFVEYLAILDNIDPTSLEAINGSSFFKVFLWVIGKYIASNNCEQIVAEYLSVVDNHPKITKKTAQGAISAIIQLCIAIYDDSHHPSAGALIHTPQ